MDSNDTLCPKERINYIPTVAEYREGEFVGEKIIKLALNEFRSLNSSILKIRSVSRACNLITEIMSIQKVYKQLYQIHISVKPFCS